MTRSRALAAVLALLVPVLALTAPTTHADEPAADTSARAGVPKAWTIRGSGHGHGVGMAQYGAFAMAVQGRSAERILEYYYAGAELDTAANPWSDIAVQVLGSAGDPRATTLSLSEGEWRLRASADGADLASGGPAHRVTLEPVEDRVRARITQDGATETVTRATLVLQWTGTRAWPGTAGVVSVTGAHGRYRHGTLTATNIGGRVNLVNDVRINDEYLYGIDEMPSLWGTADAGGFAALQAQAVVARNYAIRAKVAREGAPIASCACHLYDDTRSQHFTGWRKQGGQAGRIWVRAVDSTRQDAVDPEADRVWVLRAEGGIAETPFFSRSGRVRGAGKGTARNGDVFGTAQQSHLQHRADPYSFAGEPDRKYLSWTDRLTQRAAQRLFGLRRVVRIVVADRYSSGQVRTLRAVAPNGRVARRTRTADGWRVALGVKGSWIAGFAARQ